MLEALLHRGPDDGGCWIDEERGMAIGQRRLSILDLSSEGHQPKLSADERWVVSYNGEIYNFLELKQELLALGHSFKGSSDTEVLLATVQEWGVEQAIPRLAGMFAIALWDRQEQELWLVRDRIGIKPLYYGWNHNSFFFASEVGAIEAFPDFSGEVDREAVALFLRHNYIPCPFSIYQGIKKLAPGQMLSIKPMVGGEPRIRTYWSARDNTRLFQSERESRISQNFNEAVDELESLLLKVVEQHMLSDVPLGAFLSGGVDSSLVVALMSDLSSRPVQSFTIGMEEKGYNEAGHAKAVAQHLKTDHTELILRPDEVLEKIPEILSLVDEPFADSSQIPTWFVSRLARDSVTVSLSGDGGDELFSGYVRYTWAHKVDRLRRMAPGPLRPALRGVLRSLSPESWDRVFDLVNPALPTRFRHAHMGQKLHRLARVFDCNSPSELYIHLVSHLGNAFDVVKGAIPKNTLLEDPESWAASEDYSEQMMLLDLLTYLPDDILTKVDRASMGVSLESRVPLLDHRVIEHAWKLPLCQKEQNGIGKRVLREVLYRRVPRELIERPKMGFGIPIGQWLRGPLRPWAEELISEKRLDNEGIFDTSFVRSLWREHLSEKMNHEYLLWNFLVFQGWYSKRF